MFLIKNLHLVNKKTPIFHPLWATGYEGFEISPVSPAALYNDTGYFHFQDGAWTLSSQPTYYTPDEIREYLPLWQGAIAFISASESIQIGYEIEGSSLEYLLDFAIPDFFGQVAVCLSRWTQIQDSASELPPGINLERCSTIKIASPNQAVCFGKSSQGKIFSLVPLTNGTARLLLEYKPLVERLHFDYFYQITELPCILINLLNRENYRHLGIYGESIRTKDNRPVDSTSIFQYDQRIEIIVVGEQETDVETIASSLINKIYLSSKMYLPPFAEDVFLQIKAKVTYNVKLEKVLGNVKSCKFDLLVIGLLEGQA